MPPGVVRSPHRDVALRCATWSIEVRTPLSVERREIDTFKIRVAASPKARRETVAVCETKARAGMLDPSYDEGEDDARPDAGEPAAHLVADRARGPMSSGC